jgi:D-glycero-D-manno-heptose 1,7-bisphosphate phosphatase
MSKYIVFDRDGTLIKHIPYLSNPSQVKLFGDTIKSINLLRENGVKLFLHTNQSGVSRNFFKIEDAISCNNKLIELLGMGENIFEKICIAEDYPAKEDSYRKPSPKFGLEIIEKYKINKQNLFYVGDSTSDLETALNIGCKCFGVNTGLIDLKSSEENKIRFDISENLYEVVNKILKN